MTEPGSAPLLAMEGVDKRFGATVALNRASFSIAPGEVHALIGENGAGKSTLMKILAGALTPDRGTMTLAGKPFSPRDPLAARHAGIAMIYQELTIAPHLTVAENILLGREEHAFGWIRRRKPRERVEAALARLGRPELHPDTPAGQLLPASRQLIEIARALAHEAQVIIMDEPTSSLGAEEIESLFRVIDGLRSEGIGIVYISHFLEEVQRIADRYTVLRDGEVVDRGAIADASVESFVTAMLGRPLDEMFPHVPHERGEALLELKGLAGLRTPVEASLTLHRGEILGIAGMVGSGRTELLRALFGLDPIGQGAVTLAKRTVNSIDPHRSLRWGAGLASEDRKEEGLALSRSIAENTTLSRLTGLHRLGWIRGGEERRVVSHWTTFVPAGRNRNGFEHLTTF